MQRIAIVGEGYTRSSSIAPPSMIAAIASPGFKPELVEPRLSAFPGTPLGRGR